MRKTQPKRQRIPRRGPGVAELEKILKEQEGQDSETQFQDISPPPPPPPPPSPPPPSPFLFQPHHQSPCPPSLNSPLPPPPPLGPPVPFLPPRDYSSWSNLPLFPTLDLIPPPLPTAADAAAEKPVFPTTAKSDTQMNIPPHFFPSFQFSASSLNRQYYNSMVNFIPGGSASSSPSAASSAPRYFHQIEHPSSQRSTDFNLRWTSPEEQEQMVSAKRARSFLEESHRDPNFESRRVIPIFSNVAAKESSSSSSSSLEMNRTALNLDSSFTFRGTKRGFAGQLMSSTKSSGSYQLPEDHSSNLMALGSSSTPNQFAPFDFQETMEASKHRDDGGSASDSNKITFNSSAIGSKAEAEAKAKGDDIDLDLKL